MKLSAFLCSYGPMYDQGATTFEVIDRAASQGFGAVEPFPCADLDTVDDARRVGGYAREKGLEVSCFSTCCELLGPDSHETAELMRRRIDMAAAMGSPLFHHIHPSAPDAAAPRRSPLCRGAGGGASPGPRAV